MVIYIMIYIYIDIYQAFWAFFQAENLVLEMAWLSALRWSIFAHLETFWLRRSEVWDLKGSKMVKRNATYENMIKYG